MDRNEPSPPSSLFEDCAAGGVRAEELFRAALLPFLIAEGRAYPRDTRGVCRRTQVLSMPPDMYTTENGSVYEPRKTRSAFFFRLRPASSLSLSSSLPPPSGSTSSYTVKWILSSMRMSAAGE